MTDMAAIVQRLASPKGARLALLALGMLAVALVAAPIAILFKAQDDHLARSLSQLAGLRAEAAAGPRFRTQLAELRRSAATVQGAIQSTSTALAQAKLQQTIESLVNGNGSSIRSAQILPASQEHGFETIAIQYDLMVPMSKLGSVLYAIETHVPYLLVDDVQISSSQSWQAANGQPQDPSLDIRWTVRAYRWRSQR
jgi:hypothetical protein